MIVYQSIPYISSAITIVSATVVLMNKRLGKAAKWLLFGFLTLSAAMPCAQILVSGGTGLSPDGIWRTAFALFLPVSGLGLMFVWSIEYTGGKNIIIFERNAIIALLPQIPILLALFFYDSSDILNSKNPEGLISFGLTGYIASSYLLFIAVVTISKLEQLVRESEERIRWVIKYLALGMASSYGAIIYIASKALLYSYKDAYLHQDSFYVYTCIVPISCILILISLRRFSGLAKITVSHHFIYGTFTFAGVGLYLIALALFVRWIRDNSTLGIEVEGILYVVSVIVLAAMLLWTSFRHRMRSWIRQNIFSGNYDYRQYWMEATDKVKSVAGTESSALELAMIIQRALGAIDISVWLRKRNPECLELAGALGCVADTNRRKFKGIINKFVNIADPITREEADGMNDGRVSEFCRHCNATLLAPMCSSDRFVGILAIGSDRSGLGYNSEAREFLRVLANHAAGEFHKHELLETLVASKEAEAFKSFSTFLLHDLKNFASTLSLVAKNASRHQEKPEFQQDAFHSIFETAERMKHLCNSLRSFSANIAINKRRRDLNQIIRSTVSNMNSGFSNPVKLELDELPPIEFDDKEVVSVLQNVLMNAQQAIPSSGSILVRSVKRNETAEIHVIDDGAGISPQFIKEELFLPFHTTKSEGLGIGLFQCKKIMEAHGGSIEIESEEGKGTVVRIGFPIHMENVAMA